MCSETFLFILHTVERNKYRWVKNVFHLFEVFFPGWFFIVWAQSCSATETANSDKSTTGSIVGTTGQQVTITCDPNFQNNGATVTWLCGSNQQWVGPECTGNFLSLFYLNPEFNLYSRVVFYFEYCYNWSFFYQQTSEES